MANTLFARLLRALAFGHKPVFEHWPAPPDSLPPLDLAQRSLGPLRFGCAATEARAFGRPDRHERPSTGMSRFLYAGLGLELDFDDYEGLDYAAFLIAPDPHGPRHPRLRHCSPRLVTGEQLSAATTEMDLHRIFGAPTHVDEEDADEICLYFLAHGLRVEAELRPDRTLKRINLHPSAPD
jgi:hypothetical protein